MSTDFEKVLVKDDRLLTTSAIKYAVNKGGQNMTSATFKAVSQSNSSHTFNIQVPSEQTIIDRRVLWKSKVNLVITGTPANTQYLVNYGSTDALAPFPLHQLTSVMTATINNNSVSINMRDVLPAILRFNDSRELNRYNGYTPTLFDTYASYADATNANNNPLGSYINSADNDIVPRGAWVLDSIAGNTVGDGSTAKTVTLSFTVTEPLLLSPFIFADPKSNNQGFYGVQNMNFVFNIGDASRVWRTSTMADASTGKAIALQSAGFEDSELIFNFLTPHPSDVMPARNVVPYYELPRYISSNFTAIASGASSTLRTSTIQLNQIPDKLVMFVRPNTATNATPDYFLSIDSVSVNFNNQSGILASATKQDLYRYSVENGSNQNWFEFSGKANKFASGASSTIATAGSVLVLEFGKDIQITEDFYSAGSLGNFNLQVNVTATNQTGASVTPEVVIITMNSGVFVNERGTSSTYTGILTKQDVLDASAQEPYGRAEVQRMVGGGFLDTLKSVAGKLLPKLPGLAKGILSQMEHPAAKKGAQVLGALGYAKPADRLAGRLM